MVIQQYYIQFQSPFGSQAARLQWVYQAPPRLSNNLFRYCQNQLIETGINYQGTGLSLLSALPDVNKDREKLPRQHQRSPHLLSYLLFRQLVTQSQSQGLQFFYIINHTSLRAIIQSLNHSLEQRGITINQALNYLYIVRITTINQLEVFRKSIPKITTKKYQDRAYNTHFNFDKHIGQLQKFNILFAYNRLHCLGMKLVALMFKQNRGWCPAADIGSQGQCLRDGTMIRLYESQAACQ